MRVGIITLHKTNNFGACLQAYALYKYICNQGHDCEIIDLLRPIHCGYRYSNKYVNTRKRQPSFTRLKLRALKSIVLRRKVDDLPGMTRYAYEKFAMCNSLCSYSRLYKSIDALYANPPQYDIYISGSDQIWNPTIGFCLEPYFLTFAPSGSRKISFASSMGILELKESEKKQMREWLQSYSNISVREVQTQKLIQSFIHRKVEQVCDPSFLIDRAEWAALAQGFVDPHPYILLFTVNYSKSLLDYGIKLSKEGQRPLYYLCLNQPDNVCGDYIPVINAGPNEFLQLIMNSSMVITNSFHGTVFSLILGVENFFSYIPDGEKRAQRILDLLCRFNLKSHIINDFEMSFDSLSSIKINHERVNGHVDKEKELGRDFLRNVLCENDN